MNFKWINLNGNRIKYYNNGKIVSIQNNFKKGEKHQLLLKMLWWFQSRIQRFGTI